MPALPPELVAEISERIRDPRLRHGQDQGAYAGTFANPGDLAREIGLPGGAANLGYALVLEQMKLWGQELPPMHVMRGQGFVGATADLPDLYRLARPATEDEFAALEAVIGHSLPEDLRQLFGIANGGWGPGSAYTVDHGTGFNSTQGAASMWLDLRRRGADYCNSVEWPANLVPIADMMGAVGYDLDSGRIVAFNEYFADDGLSAEEAFREVAPDLATMLEDWLSK